MDAAQHNAKQPDSWDPERLDRVDLVEYVTERLREEIVQGTFAPSTDLPSEATLAERLGVSRPVVREAMRTLRTQGLVEVSQGRRARVKPADPQASIDALDTLLRRSARLAPDLVEARRLLETETAALAARRARAEDLSELEQSIEDLKSAASAEAACEADMAFHRHLAHASGNLVFAVLIQALRGPLLESLQKTFERAGADCALRGHIPILAAVRAGDAQLAREAMLAHIDEAEQLLLESEGNRRETSSC